MSEMAYPRRGIDVLNTSVTELMLLAIFFILLALAIAQDNLAGAETDNKDLRATISSQATEIADLKKQIEEFRNTVGLSESELRDTLFKHKTRIDVLSREKDALGEELGKTRLALETAHRKLDEALDEARKLKQQLTELTKQSGSADDLRDGLSELKRIAAANGIDPDAPLRDVLGKLESRIGALSGEAEKLRQRLKAAGVTATESERAEGEVITARCWSENERRPDALFSIYLRADGYRVEKAWPKVRDYDANSSQWVRSMAIAKVLSEDQFRQLGHAIRTESEKRQPPCIFVANVRADDENLPTVKQLERMQRIVDRYFYTR